MGILNTEKKQEKDKKFVEFLLKKYSKNKKTRPVEFIVASSASAKQALVSLLLEKAHNKKLVNPEANGNLIGIFGKPGTGKSHAFTRIFEPYLRSINESKTLKKGAFMGYAALNIGSFTLHSQLGLAIANNSIKTIKNLGNSNISQNKHDKKNVWINVISLMIDEISQISAALLIQICMALCIIKECKKIFGNLNMFFFGDFYQMESISPSLFRTLNECNVSKTNSNDGIEITQGRGLWHQLDYVIFLDEPQRAKDKLFSKIKRRIRNGCCEKEDIDVLNKLTIQQSSLIHANKFREAPFYTTRHYEIDYINEKRIHFYASQYNKQILKWKTPIFVNGKQISSESWIYEMLYQERFKFTQKNLKKIGRQFIYCEGAPYKILVTPKHGKHTGTVTANIGVMVGIQLNSKEKIIRQNTNTKIRTLLYPPKVIFIHLRKHTLQQKLKGLEHLPIGTVPIFPGYETITLNIQKINEKWFNLYSGPAYNVPSEIKLKLFGFKLAPAFANTDYGCQGSTQTHIITNIIPGPNAKKNSSTSAYVILSRATSLDGILLSHPVPEQCLQNNPIPDLIQETCRLKQIERETLKNKRYLIEKLITQVKDIKTRLDRKFTDVDHVSIWVKTVMKYLSNLIINCEKLLNIPKQVKTCISCLEICLSDENHPRCFECIQDNIPPLDLKKCFCGQKYSWTKRNGITRTGNKCDKCTKQYMNIKKKQDFTGWKRKRCLSCNNFTVSKLSKFCFKCDPRLISKYKKKKIVQKQKKHKVPETKEIMMELKNCQSIKPDKGIYHIDPSIKNFPSSNTNYSITKRNYEKSYNIIGTIPSVQKWNYAKLENPCLNFCFMNSAIQFILAIKPLSNLLCKGYSKKYSKTESFLSESEKIEILNDQNMSILPQKEAMKFFIIEFETLVTNMLNNPNKTFSASKVTKRFEKIEPGFIYGSQWDCSSVVDTFLTQYDKFIYNEQFAGHTRAQEVIDSVKVTMKISTQCNKCQNIEKREEKEYFLFIPLVNDVENIFKPFYSTFKFCCGICNALARNPHPRLQTGAFQKAQVKTIGQYLLTKFGRANFNGVKITHKVTIPLSNNFLAKNLKLEAWIEHIGQRINSGHYFMIRREGESFIKMSDDIFTIYKNNYIAESKSCYIALLKSL